MIPTVRCEKHGLVRAEVKHICKVCLAEQQAAAPRIAMPDLLRNIRAVLSAECLLDDHQISAMMEEIEVVLKDHYAKSDKGGK